MKRALFPGAVCALWLLAAAMPASAQTFVQGKECDSSSAGTSQACAYTSNLGAAHLLIVLADADVNGLTLTISDTLGHSWTNFGGPVNNTVGGSYVQSWYVCSSSSGADTVTVSSGSTNTDWFVMIHEYSGMATSGCLDVTGTANNVSSTTSCTSSATTTQATELIWGGMEVGTASSVGSGFTQRENGNGGFGITEDKNVTTTGSYNACWSNPSNGSLSGIMGAFKAAGGGAAKPHQLTTLGVG